MRFLTILATSIFFGALWAHDGHIEAFSAWVRSVPPSANAKAAFMRLKNPSVSAVKLIDIKSDSFAKVELHRPG